MGIARHYKESDKVEVTLLTPVGEERVQIRVVPSIAFKEGRYKAE